MESNNYGSTTILCLKKIYPMGKIFRSRQDSDNIIHYGYRTSSKTKPIMLGNLRQELASEFVIRSPLLRDELSTFAEQVNGKMEAEPGCFDDRVMAIAVCLMGAKRAGFMLEHEEYQQNIASYIDPFSLEGIIDNLKNRKGQKDNLPIPRQDLGALH